MKRLFAALKIQTDDRFLASYRKLMSELRQEPIKWVEEHNIHITLKFFGETDERRIPGIVEMLRRRATETTRFSLRLKGLGIFGSSYAPRVIWVGLEPYTDLVKLMKNVHDDMAGLGFERDRQNLVPHLTLGRVKSLRDKVLFQRTLDRYRDLSSEERVMQEIILYESVLRPQGPVYTALERLPLLKSELP